MWFYAKNGEQQGPVEADEIRRQRRNGEISDEVLVWKEGMAQWTALGEVLELREPVPAAAPENPGQGMPATESPSSSSTVQPQGAQPVQAAPAVQQAQAISAPHLVAPMQQNTMALVSMILGILSFGSCVLTSIPAIICGHIARKQMKNSPVPQSGQGMATTGLILGYLLTILTILAVLGMIASAWVEASGTSSSLSAPPAAP